MTRRGGSRPVRQGPAPVGRAWDGLGETWSRTGPREERRLIPDRGYERTARAAARPPARVRGTDASDAARRKPASRR